MRRVLFFGAILLCGSANLARAEVLSFTQSFVADFEFQLLADTPINPGGPLTPYIPFQAKGDLTFTFDPMLNDPSLPDSAAITGFTGVLDGVIGPVLPYTISPNVQFVGGMLTDIVRGAGGEVVSANVSGLSAFWELLGPPGSGLRLYGDAPLVFNGPIGGLPFAFGDVLAGPDPFNVYLDTGAGLGGDPLVAYGRNRTLRAVPEPSSLALLGLGAASLARFVRRRKTAATAGA